MSGTVDRGSDRANHWLAQLSHELRTPLASIRGYADLLAQDGALEHAGLSRAGAAARIKRHSERLLAFAEKLCDLYVLETAGVEVDPVWIAPASPVEKIGDELAGTPEVAARLEAVADDGLPEQIRTDPELLHLVLATLVANALRFSGEDCVGLSVSAAGPDHISYRVSDRGPGIPSARLRALFEPFAVEGPELDRSYGGSGLGLALVARRVRMLGGIVLVESDKERGTCFRLELPIAGPSS